MRPHSPHQGGTLPPDRYAAEHPAGLLRPPLGGTLDDVRAFPGVDNCYAFGETHHFTAREGFDADGLRSYLEGLGHPAVCLQPAKATIEDCYMLLAKQ